jgi:hypothetical protein
MKDSDLIDSTKGLELSKNHNQPESDGSVNLAKTPYSESKSYGYSESHSSSSILDESKRQKTNTPKSIPVKPIKQDPLKNLLQSLKTFPKEDLITIRDRTDSLIDRREKAERKAALKEAKEMMEKYGFTPEELTEK